MCQDKKRAASVGVEVRQVSRVLDGHNQNVAGVYRRNVHERDARVISIHHASRNTTVDDRAENALVHLVLIVSESESRKSSRAAPSRLSRTLRMLENDVVPCRLASRQLDRQA